MTNPSANHVGFRSAVSNRNVLPGWTAIQGQPDRLEVQLDVDPADLAREEACLLMDCWMGTDLVLQSVVPLRVFRSPESWCVFLPAQGRLYLRAIDLQPSPPFMAGQWITVDATVGPLTVNHVSVKFPDQLPQLAPRS